MRKPTVKLFFILWLFVSFLPLCIPAANGAESSVSLTPVAGGDAPAGTPLSPGEINARSAVLLEVSTGTILFEQNADEPIEPASFTKILTLYLINEALKEGILHLDDEIYISEKAWRTGGSKMFVKVDTRVPLKDIIKGIAVVSGNDACVAAAEHLAGSIDTFVDSMNRKSRELGLTGSHFVNPHGLPAKGQLTTARDMAKLDTAYLRQFPESLEFHSLQEYSYNNITQPNRNSLLERDSSVDGLKTGYVSGAGYHLSATAKKGSMRLLAVVMGAPKPADREREAAKLLNFGFHTYTLVKPFSLENKIATIKVWKGEKDQADLYPSEAPGLVIARAGENSLRWEITTNDRVTAPVAAGTKLGEIIFYVSGTPLKTIPLVTHEELVQAGWFKRSWHSILQLVHANLKTLLVAAGIVMIILLLLIIIVRRRSKRRSRRGLSFR